MTARHFNAGVGKQMSMRDGFVVGGPLILLRLESAAVFTAAILIYAHLGLTWWAFVALILIPDASMLGCLANARIGAATYNAVHTATAPIALLGLAFLLGDPLSLGAIWLAHIGLDRASRIRISVLWAERRSDRTRQRSASRAIGAAAGLPKL